jgi:hypothetical protein
MKSSRPVSSEGGRRVARPGGFWLRSLGVVLLFGSLGLVSCQALLIL